MNSLNYAMTYACVHTANAVRSLAAKTRQRAREFRRDESGMEIIAVVLILLVVVALAVIFHKNIASFFNTLWDKIFGEVDPNKPKNDSWGNPEKADGTYIKMFDFV